MSRSGFGPDYVAAGPTDHYTIVSSNYAAGHLSQGTKPDIRNLSVRGRAASVVHSETVMRAQLPKPVLTLPKLSAETAISARDRLPRIEDGAARLFADLARREASDHATLERARRAMAMRGQRS